MQNIDNYTYSIQKIFKKIKRNKGKNTILKIKKLVQKYSKIKSAFVLINVYIY